jgi:hypothetical protein
MGFELGRVPLVRYSRYDRLATQAFLTFTLLVPPTDWRRRPSTPSGRTWPRPRSVSSSRTARPSHLSGAASFPLITAPAAGAVQAAGPAEVEKLLRERFAKIGIEAGKPFKFDKLTADQKADLVFLPDQPQAPATTGQSANALYVGGLYRDILGRQADTAGLNYWVGQPAQ